MRSFAVAVALALASVAPLGAQTFGPGLRAPAIPNGQRIEPAGERVTRPAPPLIVRHPGPVLVVVPLVPVVPVTALDVAPLVSPVSSNVPSNVATSVAAPADEPFYCFVDHARFADREAFIRHLHEAHAVPSERALASCHLVESGQLVFFGP